MVQQTTKSFEKGSPKCSDTSTRNHLVNYYCSLLKFSLKDDIVAGIFIFGFILTILSVEILSFQFGTLTAKFYEILPKRNGPEFIQIISRFGTFIFMMAMGKGTLMGTKALLSRSMRRNLTQYFHEKYIKFSGLKQNIFNETDVDKLPLDSPDQRIADDIFKFCQGILDIFEIIFISPVLIFFYTLQVYDKLSFTSLSLIYSHFLISFFILRFGMKQLKELTVKLEEREANFRSEHVNIKVNSESLLLINSGNLFERIKESLNFQLMKLLFTKKKLIITESIMEIGKTFFSYSGSFLNFLLLAGELTWGRWKTETDITKITNLISLTSFLSLYLIFQLSRMTSVIDSLGILNGQVQRLGQLLKRIDNCSVNGNSDNSDHSDLSSLEPDNFEVSIKNITIKPGHDIFISGSNGAGKTSILRYLTGVWNPSEEKDDENKILIKLADNLFKYPVNFADFNLHSRPFLMTCPQNYVLFTGSLYDILGLKHQEVDNMQDKDEESILLKTKTALDDLVRSVLITTGLPIERLEPFDQVRSLTTWQTILTPGQHQRLSLSRALITRPHFIALDETCLAMNWEETSKILNEFNRLNVTVLFIDPSGKSEEDFGTFFKAKYEIK